LAAYAFAQFVFYPLFIASLVLYSWKLSLILLGIKLLVQGIIYGRTMSKLGEKDLLPFFLFFDLWMFFYYWMFAPALLRKPKQHWK
jgi:hypothetical protein